MLDTVGRGKTHRTRPVVNGKLSISLKLLEACLNPNKEQLESMFDLKPIFRFYDFKAQKQILNGCIIILKS